MSDLKHIQQRGRVYRSLTKQGKLEEIAAKEPQRFLYANDEHKMIIYKRHPQHTVATMMVADYAAKYVLAYEIGEFSVFKSPGETHGNICNVLREVLGVKEPYLNEYGRVIISDNDCIVLALMGIK